MGIDFFENISTSSIFHHNAKTVRTTIEKCLFEFDNILVVEGGEDSNLVKGIVLFFVLHGSNFDFFHSIDLAVLFSFDHENLSECAFSKFPEYLKIFQ